MKMTQAELNAIIKAHGLWLKGHRDGVRMDISGPNKDEITGDYCPECGAMTKLEGSYEVCIKCGAILGLDDLDL